MEEPTPVRGANFSQVQARLFTKPNDLEARFTMPSEKKVQTALDVEQQMAQMFLEWMVFVVGGGIGQYSLVRKDKMGLLARIDSLYRPPTMEEMLKDVQMYGTSLLKPMDGAQDEKAAMRVIAHQGAPHVYVGPDRIMLHVYAASFFQGDIPISLRRLMASADRIANPAPGARHEGYHLFHAENGQVRDLDFQQLGEYREEDMRDMGQVVQESGRLLFTLYNVVNDITHMTWERNQEYLKTIVRGRGALA